MSVKEKCPICLNICDHKSQQGVNLYLGCSNCKGWWTKEIRPRDYSGEAQSRNHYASLSRMSAKFVRLLEETRIHPQSYLDVGCGQGYLVDEIAKRFESYAVGIDIRKHKDSKPGVVISDFLSWNTEDSFDFISFFDSLEHMKNLDEVLLKAKSLLRPDGVMYISVPRSRGSRRFEINDHWYVFSKDSVSILFDRVGLEIIDDRMDRVIKEIKNLQSFGMLVRIKR